MDHIVLNVEDDEKMITFYSKVLLFATERLEQYRRGDVPFPSVRLNADTIIDLFPKKMWQKSVGTNQDRTRLNHFCIALNKEAWENLLKRLAGQQCRHRRRSCSALGRTRRRDIDIFSRPGGYPDRGAVLRGTQQLGEMSPWIVSGKGRFHVISHRFYSHNNVIKSDSPKLSNYRYRDVYRGTP